MDLISMDTKLNDVSNLILTNNTNNCNYYSNNRNDTQLECINSQSFNQLIASHADNLGQQQSQQQQFKLDSYDLFISLGDLVYSPAEEFDNFYFLEEKSYLEENLV